MPCVTNSTIRSSNRLIYRVLSFTFLLVIMKPTWVEHVMRALPPWYSYPASCNTERGVWLSCDHKAIIASDHRFSQLSWRDSPIWLVFLVAIALLRESLSSYFWHHGRLKCLFYIFHIYILAIRLAESSNIWRGNAERLDWSPTPIAYFILHQKPGRDATGVAITSNKTAKPLWNKTWPCPVTRNKIGVLSIARRHDVYQYTRSISLSS